MIRGGEVARRSTRGGSFLSTLSFDGLSEGESRSWSLVLRTFELSPSVSRLPFPLLSSTRASSFELRSRLRRFPRSPSFADDLPLSLSS